MPARTRTHALVRTGLALALTAGLAACGDAEEAATAAPAATAEATAPAPTEAETGSDKESVAIQAPSEAVTEAGPTATEEAPASAAPAAPAAGGADLATLQQGVLSALGRTDVAAAAAELGPFPTEITFPEGAVLAGIDLSWRDGRVLSPDLEIALPIEVQTTALALTTQKIEEVQPLLVDVIAAAGFQQGPSGVTSSTEGDGTQVVSGFFLREADDSSSEDLFLTLVARPDTDHVEIEVQHTVERGDGGDVPITGWAAGFPAPDGFQLEGVELRTNYIITPSLGFSARYLAPEGDVQGALDAATGALPAGGFEIGQDPTVAGDPDLRYVDIAYPGVGEGDLTASEGSSGISLTPRIDVQFPLPAALEPFLIG